MILGFSSLASGETISNLWFPEPGSYPAAAVISIMAAKGERAVAAGGGVRLQAVRSLQTYLTVLSRGKCNRTHWVMCV